MQLSPPLFQHTQKINKKSITKPEMKAPKTVLLETHTSGYCPVAIAVI